VFAEVTDAPDDVAADPARLFAVTVVVGAVEGAKSMTQRTTPAPAILEIATNPTQEVTTAPAAQTA